MDSVQVENVSMETFQSLDGIDDIINRMEASSPTLDSILPPIGYDGSPGTSWRRNNAAPSVHMEVQENAKKSNLNLAVDRKGSSYRSFSGEPGDEVVEDNLAELFLTSNARESVNANYVSAGNFNTDQEIDALLGSVGPTPLSEMNDRHERHVRKLQQASHQGEAGALPITKISPVRKGKDTKIDLNAGSSLKLAVPQLTPGKPTKIDIPQTNATSAGVGETKNAPSPPAFGTTHRSAAAPHSHAHTVPKVALTKASSQKREYGFGKTHVVPSVPPAPGIRHTPRKRKPTDSGAEAYERKKQRAKDARVKLNEAIEAMSLAVQLAGTQSEQRVMGLATSNDALLKHLKDGASIASAAKKWDRPSFVASAAQLIHNLNAQAQGLHDQLSETYQQLEQARAAATSSLTPALVAASPGGGVPLVISNMNRKESETPKGKERRPGGGNTIISNADGSSMSSFTSSSPASPGIANQSKILDAVAVYLDAHSLVSCQQACRMWHKTFSNEAQWEHLLVKRFGFYNYRQWRARTESTDESSVAAPSRRLYGLMDLGNVMPHINQEGVFRLGETRLANKVSAWTFLVERSNGETLRSVEKEDGSFTSMPVVELRTIVQNTGVSSGPIIIQPQKVTVDASTRRRGEEMPEIISDERLVKRTSTLDGTPVEGTCRLHLFETIVIEAHINCRGCSTTSKFLQRANFTKILVGLGQSVTIPLVIPFPRDAAHLLH